MRPSWTSAQINRVRKRIALLSLAVLSAGAIHTLVSDDPNGMKTFFWLNASLEFYDDNDTLLETLDVFWFINHYVSYCREHGLKLNQMLWV